MDIEKAKQDLKYIIDPFRIDGTTLKYSNAVRFILSELEKKDKVINEMAKFIAGLDIDELICKDREYCTGDYEYETCEGCIKEYFTKKVEGK